MINIILCGGSGTEFFHPGDLYDDLTIEALKGNNYISKTRNKLIALMFKECGLIEKYGYGIDRIKRVSQIEEKLNIPAKTLERWIKRLKDEDKIEYRGSKKTGGYFLKRYIMNNNLNAFNESQTVEFKQVWKDDYLKMICVFVNSEGSGSNPIELNSSNLINFPLRSMVRPGRKV